MADKKSYQSAGDQRDMAFNGNPMDVRKFAVDAMNSPDTPKSTNSNAHGHKDNA